MDLFLYYETAMIHSTIIMGLRMRKYGRRINFSCEKKVQYLILNVVKIEI